MIASVTVYCSSTTGVSPRLLEAAARLGRGIAARGWTLVYGGNRVGCMGALADGAREAGGAVVGITPGGFADIAVTDALASELIVVESMRRRKELLEARGDGFVILPGGIGTLDEFFEVLVHRFLGQHDKPIVLLNAEGLLDPLIELLRRGERDGLIRPRTRLLYAVAADVDEALDLLVAARR